MRTESIQPISSSPTDLQEILGELELLCVAAERLEMELAPELERIDPLYRESARNLVHYLALRGFDLRPLQGRLASLGLSSLGRAERHVMPSLLAVRRALAAILGGTTSGAETAERDFAGSRLRLDSNASDILGNRRPGRNTRIMVTLPPEGATEPALVDQMIRQGMDVARINCAHDSEDTWRSMIANIRASTAASGGPCRIVMDLAGPKLRTGVLADGPQVLRIRPRRDALGRVIAPKRLRLIPDVPGAGPRPGVPVSKEALFAAKRGDEFRFRDTRDKKRRFVVVGKDEYGLRVECSKPAYLEAGTRLRLHRLDDDEIVDATVGELPAVEQPILLRKGDVLVLRLGSEPGRPAKFNPAGAVKTPAHISCAAPEVFRHVRKGAPVFLNDGKIKGIVKSVGKHEMKIGITDARASGSRLRGNKGINFPESDLHISGLTDKDRADLEFIARNADAVSLSFVRDAGDIVELHEQLKQYPRNRLGVILKIETEQGFTNLARLLLTAMRRYPVGVMIARGDLAVECGWERLAEIQEEMLWFCEAAQVPVIWATAVLESETKKGRPSRAEISDASMSQRADCVMLNKGSHIVEAIRMLDDILRRMRRHQHKKTAMLRKLAIAGVLGRGADPAELPAFRCAHDT